jgi:hypothetical protein
MRRLSSGDALGYVGALDTMVEYTFDRIASTRIFFTLRVAICFATSLLFNSLARSSGLWSNLFGQRWRWRDNLEDRTRSTQRENTVLIREIST